MSIKAAGFCNKKISNELINMLRNIFSIFTQQWMVIFSLILCFCWSLPSFSFAGTLSFCPKLSPNFLELQLPPKQISSHHHIIRPSLLAPFAYQTIFRFPNCGHFWKYVEYLLVWVKWIFNVFSRLVCRHPWLPWWPLWVSLIHILYVVLNPMKRRYGIIIAWARLFEKWITLSTA